MSHTKLRYALLIENHLKHLKHEYGRLLSAPPPSGASFFVEFRFAKTAGPKARRSIASRWR